MNQSEIFVFKFDNLQNFLVSGSSSFFRNYRNMAMLAFEAYMGESKTTQQIKLPPVRKKLVPNVMLSSLS